MLKDMRELRSQTVRAQELYGDLWFNSEPVPVSAHRGQVILIEFWDYTDICSIRIAPYVKEWSRKYAPFGLVAIGVHTPRFPFGKNPDNIQKAIQRLGLAFPVVTDNASLIASRYDSREWPNIFLIDRSGFIRYQCAGDGNYAATEHAIQTLLYDAGVGSELPLLMDPLRETDRSGAVLYRATPSLFTGYLRGSIGNVEGYNPESVLAYEDPGIYLDGRFYADGAWLNGKDFIRLQGGAEREGHLLLEYQAAEVQSVMAPEGESGFEVIVRQDDRFLDLQNKGEDIRIGRDGRSYLVVSEPRSYELVKNPEYGRHRLKLSARSDGFAVYAFSFVSSIIPELISNN